MRILLPLALFCFPALIHALKHLSPVFRKLNPIIAAYIFGLILANTGILNDNAQPVLDILATGTVIISIPLMLFSVHLKACLKESGTTGIAMALAALSITLTLSLGSLLFGSTIESFPKVAGMLVGVYTGGTPNLAALRAGLDVPANLYLAVHSSDILISSLYLLFIMTGARRFFSFFMTTEEQEEQNIPWKEDPEPKRILNRSIVLPLLAALGLSLLIVAISYLISLFFSTESQTLVVILSLTTLSLGASAFEKVRSLPYSFELGEYFILVFSATTGAMGQFSRILEAAPGILGFVAFTVIISLLIHALLCRLFKIDTDTMLIASTAAICSPPFVPITAMSIKRPSLVAPGITAGLLGYAAGNYLGVLIFRLFSAIL